MVVDDSAGGSIERRSSDADEAPSRHVRLVVTDTDRSIRCWLKDQPVVVMDPDRGATFGVDAGDDTVLAIVKPRNGVANVRRAIRLTDPIDRKGVLAARERLEEWLRYDVTLEEYARLATRHGRIEAAREECELADDREYQALRHRLADVEAELEGLADTLDDEGFRAAFDADELGGFSGLAD